MGNELYPFYEGTLRVLDSFRTGMAWNVQQGLRTTIESTEDQKSD